MPIEFPPSFLGPDWDWPDTRRVKPIVGFKQLNIADLGDEFNRESLITRVPSSRLANLRNLAGPFIDITTSERPNRVDRSLMSDEFFQMSTSRGALFGISRDSVGAILGLCDVYIFRSDTQEYVGKTRSDANGLWMYYVGSGTFWVRLYKQGTPFDFAGTSVNNLYNDIDDPGPYLGFYVSNTGDDNNDGLTPGNAVATIQHAMDIAGANDTILLKRGGIWRETVVPSGFNQTITAYDSGALPIISGADVVTGFSGGGGETAGGIIDIDHDDGTLAEYTSTTGTGFAISTVQKRSGTHSLAFTSGSGNTQSNITALADQNIRYCLFGLWAAAGALANSTTSNFFSVYQSTTVGFTLQLYSNGSGNISQIGVFNNAGSNEMIAATNITFNLSAWNTIELRFKVGTSDGEAQLWVNGISVANNSSLNTSALVGDDNFRFRATANSVGPLYMDDFKVSATRIGAVPVWSATYATLPMQLFVDGTRGLRVATSGAVDAPGEWHWASNTLTVGGPLTGATPVVEASVRQYCVNASTMDNFSIEYVQAEKAGYRGIVLNEAQAPSVTNCVITGHRVAGVIADANTTLCVGGRINNNVVSDIGAVGLSSGGQIADWQINGNTISGCCRMHHGLLDGHPEQQFSGGIKVWGWGVSDWINGLSVSGNTVSDCMPQFDLGVEPELRGYGIWLDEIITPPIRTQVVDNIVHDCYGAGIFIEKADNTDVIGNLVYDCAANVFRGCIDVQANAAGYDPILNEPGIFPHDCSNCLIEHNTVDGGWWAFHLGATTTDCHVFNNIVRNNIFIGSSNQEGFFDGGGANNGTHGSGNVYTFNCYDAQRSNFINWNGTLYSTYAAVEAVAGAAFDLNIEADPLFTNEAGHDYTLQGGSPCVGTASDAGNVGAF